MSVKVKDLKDQTGTIGTRPILLCVVCQSEYSANRGDYFMADPETVMECCDSPMLLVKKQTQYEEVTN